VWQLRILLLYIPWRRVIQEPIVAQLIATFPDLEVENSTPHPIMKLVKSCTRSVIYILILSCWLRDSFQVVSLSLSLSLSLALVISSSCFPVRNIALKFSLLANMTGFYVFMRIQLLLRSGVHLCCSQPILNVRVATLKMSLYLCKVISWWFVTLTWTASYRLWCDRLRGMCWYPHFMMSFHLVEDLHSQF